MPNRVDFSGGVSYLIQKGAAGFEFIVMRYDRANTFRTMTVILIYHLSPGFIPQAEAMRRGKARGPRSSSLSRRSNAIQVRSRELKAVVLAETTLAETTLAEAG